MLVGVGIQGIDRDRELLAWVNFDAILFMDGDIEEIRALRRMGWQGRAFLRFYDSDMMGKPGSARATEHMAWLEANDDVGITDIISANELNLDGEHALPHPSGSWQTPEALTAIDTWLTDYYYLFLARNHYRLHWPALSPSVPGLNSHPHRWASLGLYAAHDIHSYYGDSITLEQQLDNLRAHGARGQFYVTETMGGPWNGYLAFLDRARRLGVDGCLWFLWRGNSEWIKYDLLDHINLHQLRNYIIANREEVIVPPTTIDWVASWLRDMWERQGVRPAETDAVFQYCVKQAKESGRVIVPLFAPDGNYQNWGHDRYVLCYTQPPLHFEKNVWEVKEGFPPL